MARRYEHDIYDNLDNTALAFPAVTNGVNPNVFRFSAALQENIDPEILEDALNDTMEKLPAFNVKLKKGLFWYFFQRNLEPCLVKEERETPCQYLSKYENNAHLFRVTYYAKRINVEIYHVLCDGTGGIRFLHVLVGCYLNRKYGLNLPVEIGIEGKSNKELKTDAYALCSRTTKKTRSPIQEKAYQIRGYRFEKGICSYINGSMAVKEISALAKAYGGTITMYLATVLLFSIYEGFYKFEESRLPIVLSLPVNLRNIFQADMIRNFFVAVDIGVNFSEKEYTFAEVFQLVKKQLQEKTEPAYLQEKVRYNINAQHNMALRFTPLFAKNLGLNLVYQAGVQSHTCTFSNLGVFTFPAAYSDYVTTVDCGISPSPGHPLKCTIASYNGNLIFTFTSCIGETDIQKWFFRYLANQGVAVTITANEVMA